MKFRHGREFSREEPEVVIDYLRGIKTQKLEIKSENLSLFAEGEEMLLSVGSECFPVRQSFFYKLLKWYNFPVSQLHRLSTESLLSIGNDFLINIDNRVNIVLENGEAAAITSLQYSELKDLTLFELIKGLKIRSVSRNDFFSCIEVKEKFTIKPFPGDTIGMGVVIYNSETGFRSFSVYSYLLRYICTNGAVVRINQKYERLVHYRKKEIEFRKLIDTKISALGEEKEQILGILTGMGNIIPGEGFLKEIKNKVSAVIGLSQTKNLFSYFHSGETMYDLFNLITSEANHQNLGARIRLQELAGDLITQK